MQGDMAIWLACAATIGFVLGMLLVTLQNIGRLDRLRDEFDSEFSGLMKEYEVLRDSYSKLSHEIEYDRKTLVNAYREAYNRLDAKGMAGELTYPDPRRVTVETKFGLLVAEVFSDRPEPFTEIGVELHRPDGKKYQVAVIGANEGEHPDMPVEYGGCLHVYLWDGDDSDCSDTFYFKPDGDGYYEQSDEVMEGAE